MKRPSVLVWSIVALGSAALACGGGAGRQAATAEALANSLNQTAEASGEVVGSGASLQTAEAEATARSQEIEATQTAQIMQTAEAAATLAADFEPIRMELPQYGIDPSEGEPGWLHPPVTLSIEGSMQTDYANQFIATVVRDFVISADITWNTTGLSGCGFLFRSDGNEEAINQYLVVATRTGTGSLSFITQTDGALFFNDTLSLSFLDPTFEWQNDTTNRITVVGRGDTFSVYTNGNQVLQRTASEFERGFVAMVALSQSGSTVCEFNNAWLWLLD